MNLRINTISKSAFTVLIAAFLMLTALQAASVNAAIPSPETNSETAEASAKTASSEDTAPAAEDQTAEEHSADTAETSAAASEDTSAAASTETAAEEERPLTAGLTSLPDRFLSDIDRALGNEEGEKNRYVAHTGRCGKAAQNSLLAFQLAADAGYWAIETDIRWTSDHVIICYHDESFDSHSDGTGMVEDCTWDYVSTLHVTAGNTDDDGPQPIAAFSEYLDLCKETGRQALVDVKYCSNGYRSFLDKAYEMVAERDMVSRTIWQCSLGDYLKYIKSLDANARCWLLCGEIIADDPDMIVHAKRDLQCEGIDVPVIDQSVAELAHQNGMICVFYETDKKHKQDKCFEYGYDLVMENGF